MVIGGLGISTAATRFPAKYQGEGKGGEAVSFVCSMTAFQGIVAITLAAATVPLSLAIADFLNRPELAPLIPLVAISFVGQALYAVVTSG
jgi:O-antigen/teichoic acid export membrane protein